MMKNAGLDDDRERKDIIILRNIPKEEWLSSLSNSNESTHSAASCVNSKCDFKDKMKSVTHSYDKKIKTRDLKESSLKEESKKEHLLNIAHSECALNLEKWIEEKDQLMQIS